jgi:CubicO group peptidase (beta-lactamase class C family)
MVYAGRQDHKEVSSMSQDPIDRTLAEADALCIEAMNDGALSGLAVGIVYNGALIYAKGFGVADAATGRPVTPDTIFRIASISKTFTAIGLMQLWEQGRFRLDDPINKHLLPFQVTHPDPNAPPVTIRHMLTHRAGIGEEKSVADLLKSVVDMASGGMVKPRAAIAPLRVQYGGRLAPEVYPEQKWAYANHAFATLGQLVEDLSGESFPETMRRTVFERLGMHHSDYLLNERVSGEFAQGYELKKGRLTPAPYRKSARPGAGSVFSSVNDMALYMAALMNGGRNSHGAVLNPETLERMMQPQFEPDPRLTAMGLAFFLPRFDGHKVIWHGGSLPGFKSTMYVAPDDKIGVVVLTNTVTGEHDILGQRLLRRMLALADPVDRIPRAGVLGHPHVWSELIGFYGPRPGLNTNTRVWMSMGGELEVYVKGTRLMMRSLGGLFRKGVALFPIDGDDPLAYQGKMGKQVITVVFKRGRDGAVSRILPGLQIYGFYELHKRPVTQSLRFKSNVILGAAAGAVGALLLGRALRKK